MEDYIYYVSYGSNLLSERFFLYITGGTNEKLLVEEQGMEDKTLPKESKQVFIPYQMYFAKDTSKWGKGGVAFLDTDKYGMTLGRGYLIKKTQFESLMKQEGSWYAKKVSLKAIDGIEAFTFTNETSLPRTRPSEKYFNVILEGLLETYPSSGKENLYNYLESCFYN